MESIKIDDELWSEKVTGVSNWSVWKRRAYPVKIEIAVADKVYNIPGKKGFIYNHLEKCEQSVDNADYVITGLLGEKWPIMAETLENYEAVPEEITTEPKEFYTKVNNKDYYAIQIPAEISFTVQTRHFGILNGNVARISHRLGDYIVCTSFKEENYRIVNGDIFERMYELVQ